MDKRDKMINELSKLANISVAYDNYNNAAISIGGVFAVDASVYNEFEVRNDNGVLKVGAIGANSSVNLKGGELYAISENYSNKIPEYQNYIDTLFTQLVESVNSVHSTGYTIESTPRTGIDFFKEYKDGKLVIDDEILSDSRNIAISADGSEGNSDLAIQIMELNSQKIINNSTFGEYFNTLISKVGNDKLSSDRMSEASQMVIEQLKNQRSSYSGVSVDEEMTEIIKFQRAYDASAKLIKIADEMLDTIMNLV
jgi:flagellar hook-associated protein 1 FlgK